MIKLSHYENFIQCYPALQTEYFIKNEHIPSIKMTCFSGFLKERSILCQNVNQYVMKLLNDKKIFLCMAIGQGQYNQKVHDYYKLWKRVRKDYMLNNYELGYEYRMVIDGESFYAGCTEFKLEDLNNTLDILFDYKYQSQSFIYLTSNCSLLKESETKKLFDGIGDEKIKKLRQDKFDFASLYNNMKKNDIAINLASDGEEVEVFIGQKYD